MNITNSRATLDLSHFAATEPLGVSAASDTAALQAAINALADNGGGTLVIRNPGRPLLLNAEIVLRSRVLVEGVGRPVIKIANGAGLHRAFVSENADALFLKNPSTDEGVQRGGLVGLVIDGNRAANPFHYNPLGDAAHRALADRTALVRIYGQRFRLSDLTIRNAALHGLQTKWFAGNGGDAGDTPAAPDDIGMEATVRDVWIENCGGCGWDNAGPHDSFIENVYVIDASVDNRNCFAAFWWHGAASSRCIGLHNWRTLAGIDARYGLHNETHGADFTACEFEGANIPLREVGAATAYTSCNFYNGLLPSPEPTVIFGGEDCIMVGCKLDGDGVAIQLGETYKTANRLTMAGCQVNHHNAGRIKVVNDGGHHDIRFTGYTQVSDETPPVLVTGVLNPTSTVRMSIAVHNVATPAKSRTERFQQDPFLPYQEGVFEPSVTFATPGDLTVEYITRKGRYTRVGNRVFYDFTLVFKPMFGNATGGELRIGGFPIPPDPEEGLIDSIAAVGGFSNLKLNDNVSFYAGAVVSNQGLMTVFRQSPGGVMNAINIYQAPSGETRQLNVSGSYRVAP